MSFDVVIPTIGRPSLYTLLRTLANARGELPDRVVLVDDRRDQSQSLDRTHIDERLRSRVTIVPGKAAGPAAARNTGWRHSDAQWIAFLDDDVEVEGDWLERAAADIADLSQRDAGSQGRLRVPLPKDRPPTDWERNVFGLQSSSWITADMIYRRSLLEELGGFDERFRRAYREDAEFALRVFSLGYGIRRGSRGVLHPVRAADPWVSVRLQAGNADDVLMYALHGPNWRARANAPGGRWPYHAATVLCFTAWAALTARFAWERIADGPCTPKEIGTMLATSAVIPFAAVYHRLRGIAGAASMLRRPAQ